MRINPVFTLLWCSKDDRNANRDRRPMDNLYDFITTRAPTAQRPLLRLTLLVVEYSRFACGAVTHRASVVRALWRSTSA